MKFLTKYLKVIERSKIQLILLSVAFFCGIILGAILPSFEEKVFFSENTVNLFLNSLISGGKVSAVFLNRLFVDIFCLGIFYIASLNIFLISINVIIIMYRGYVIGALLVALLSNFGVTGLMLYIAVVFLQSLISTASLIFFTLVIIDRFKVKKCKPKCQYDLLAPLIIAFAIIILSILVQVIMLLVFLRPMNYCF